MLPTERGFAQGLTHAFARLGNAVTPPIVAWLIVMIEWRGSFIALGLGLAGQLEVLRVVARSPVAEVHAESHGG